MAVMPIPNDWDGETWCCHVIEWPSSQQWTAILLGLVTTPQRGRFWDGRTGTITDAQAIGLQIFQRNLLEDCEMGCLEDLANAINELSVSITNTIANSGNCGCTGSGSSGIFEEPASTFEDTGGNFPDGYDDRDVYLSAKCKLANYILDRWISDLTQLRSVNAAGMTSAIMATLLGALLLTPIAFALIIGLVGALLALVAISIDAFVDALDELIAWLEGVDVCLLYSAVSASEAHQNMLDELDAQTFTNDALTKEVFTYFINFDVLNILFDAAPEAINLEALEATRPCDGCDAPACGCSLDESTGVFIGTETGRSFSAPTLSIQGNSAPSGGAHQIQIGLNEGCSFDCCFKITGFSWAGVTNQPFINGTYLCTTAAFNSETSDIDDYIANETVRLAVIIQSNEGPFSIDIDVQRP